VPKAPEEIKLISHSNLFYWWPVWALAFFMALWTYIENHRFVIVPSHGTVTEEDGRYVMRFQGTDKEKSALSTTSLDNAVALSKAKSADPDLEVFRPRMSQQAWLGSMFIVVLVLTIIITNVPLRGLWSFIVILLIILLAVIVSLAKGWDTILERLGNLHIHINMAGYLFIGFAVFALWSLATWVFDRRSYVIFSAGQIRLCEHVGAGVQVYPTQGVSMEKQRDDMFRHYILGFGSGDLILKMSTGERKEIRIPNVLGIGWKLQAIERTLAQVKVSA